MKAILFPTVPALMLFWSGFASAQTIYSEDFSSSSAINQGIGYIGGFYSPQAAASQWYSSNVETTISAGALNVYTSGGIRSAGIYLPESLFAATGAGEYLLTFDVTAFLNPPTNSGIVRVWTGTGIGSPAEPETLILNSLDAVLGTFGGNASVATKVGETTFDAPAAGMEIAFTYGGSGVVALFFGSDTNPPQPAPDGWPFPIISYDNISISSVPEPSAVVISGLAGLGACLFGRRRR